jgi:glyoxylase-like metal-dependent hydrolase (beta-lactamase superfamily II)
MQRAPASRNIGRAAAWVATTEEPNMGDPAVTSKISYPFPPPEPGAYREVAQDVYWLRMPLPFRLDHINLYLVRDGDGWTIVDTGIRGRKTRDLWDQVFANLFGGAPVKRVIATHMHPDHVGQAGWLTRRCGVALWMSRTEFFMCKMLAVDGPTDVPEDAIRFYERAGFDAQQLALYQQRFGRFGAMIEPLPAGYRRMEDGDRIVIGEDEWQVVIGRGHSPEHACLYCAARGLLLSGDQVLPRISSNVSVFPTEPAANPLHEWLESCQSLRGRLPPDPLVLPSHNEPFYGLHARLGELIEGHVQGLSRLYELCATPRRVVDVFPALFKSEIGDENLLFATGESRAHLNYLTAHGVLAEDIGPDGASRFVQARPFDPTRLKELAR